MDEWQAALGPLGKLLPTHAGPPSLDELISQVSAPATPDESRQTSPVAWDGSSQDAARLTGRLSNIDEGFNEMCQTLKSSMKMEFAIPDDADEPEDEDISDVGDAAGILDRLEEEQDDIEEVECADDAPEGCEGAPSAIDSKAKYCTAS